MKSLLQRIGDYQIVEKLGRGGMADVYLAANLKSGQRVALKLVEMGEGEEARDVIEAERLGAELQRRLSLIDPRVPCIYACGELEGCLFIEMEFVEGSDLSTLIASGSLQPRDAAAIAAELCSILRNAHGISLQINEREFRAIVHGDIKPKNIRIDAAGRVRVLDFGIAKGLSVTRRLTSNLFGSVAYSSPERLESGRIDELSDLWSLGIVLYEMIEGRLPYEALNTEGLESTIRSHAAIRPLSEACPVALQQILYKALSHSPSSRYPDARNFETDLQSFISGAPTMASRESEETRRTFASAEEETRRISPEALPSREIDPATAPTSIETHEASYFQKSQRYLAAAKKWFWIAGGSLLLALCLWEGLADRAAFKFRTQLAEGRINPENAWDRYQKTHSPLGVASLILRRPMRNLLSDYCDRIYSEYRNSDASRIREGDWIRCKRLMARAVQLDSGNPKVNAMYEYANGQVLRINRQNYDAIAAFQRATAKEPGWPDPYLGLARTYISNLEDIERGTQALERARQLGISFGKRELAMMAEAYRTRGSQALDNSSLIKDADKQKELLNKAKSNFNEAIKIYLQISPWGDSAKQIARIQDSLNEADQKLTALNQSDQSNSLMPWNWFK
jgi:eukaryotic-like serine/threonine-protein kinase